VVKALWLAAIAAGVGMRRQRHKTAKFVDQNDAARAFKLSLRLLAYGNFLLNCVRTATDSGARNHVSLIRDLSSARKSASPSASETATSEASISAAMCKNSSPRLNFDGLGSTMEISV
jgi:hypothetical protein